MEVGQSKHHLLVFARLGSAAFVLLFAHVLEGAEHIGFQSLWRLVSQLNSTLEHRHREVRAGGSSQPEAVIGVTQTDIHLLLESLKLR